MGYEDADAAAQMETHGPASVSALMNEMNADAQMPDPSFPFPRTLYSQLAPFRYPEEQFFKEKGGVMFLVKRLLGAYPQSLSTFAIYMPVFAGYSALVPAMLDIPRTDAGFGKITRHLRRLSVTLTSMTAECAYCSSHACGLGDAFRGGAMWRGDKILNALPSQVNEVERIALRCVVAGTKVPGRVTTTMRKDAIALLGEEGLQQVAQCCGLMGYLNVVMDVLGSEMEDANYNFAKDVMVGTGWNPARNRPTNRSHGYSKYWDPNVPDDNAPPNFCTSCLGRNLFTETVELLSHVRKAKADDSRMMAIIPNSHSGIDVWLAKHFGTTPRFLKSIISLEVKRAMAYAVWSFLLADGKDVKDEESKPHIQSSLKIKMAYIFFMAADNGLVSTYIAALAFRRGIKASELLDALNAATKATENLASNGFEKPTSTAGPPEGETFETVILQLAVVSARRLASETFLLSEHLLPLSVAAAGVDGQEGARRVLEVLGVLGTCTMLQRVSAVLDNQEGVEESIVKEVVESEFGKELNLGALEGTACSVLFSREGQDHSGFNITKAKTAVPSLGVEAAGDEGKAVKEDLWGGNVEY